MKKLKVNKIKCLNCGDIIESKSRHDFVKCSCGSCFVDGGLYYSRMGFIDLADIQDMREWEEDDE